MSKQSSFFIYSGYWLMLFALFFGAGNLIFPVMLGQSAEAIFGQQTLDF